MRQSCLPHAAGLQAETYRSVARSRRATPLGLAPPSASAGTSTGAAAGVQARQTTAALDAMRPRTSSVRTRRGRRPRAPTSPKAAKTSSPPASGRTKPYVGLSAGLTAVTVPRRRAARPVGLHQLGGLHVMRDGALAVHRRHVSDALSHAERARRGRRRARSGHRSPSRRTSPCRPGLDIHGRRPPRACPLHVSPAGQTFSYPHSGCNFTPRRRRKRRRRRAVRRRRNLDVWPTRVNETRQRLQRRRRNGNVAASAPHHGHF